jgi:hypothetical protein
LFQEVETGCIEMISLNFWSSFARGSAFADPAGTAHAMD